MQVSIGIPHYQSITKLYEVLRCLNKQVLSSFLSWSEVEVIISNDEDNPILDLLNDDYHYTLHCVYGKNGGPSVARNRILYLARGEYIFFLDTDSIPDSLWLLEMYKLLTSKPQIMAVGGEVVAYPQKSKFNLVNQYFNEKNYLKSPLWDYKTNKIVSLITANCGFHSEVLYNIGGFDETTFKHCPPGGEDVDLSYRIRQSGYDLYVNLNAKTYHIFPKHMSSIFKKGRNYGAGIKKYVSARNIEPKSIRQPELNLFGAIKYFFYRQFRIFTFWKTHISPIYKKCIFIVFDQIFLLSYMYGYYKR